MTKEISPSMPSGIESTTPSGLYGFNMTPSRFSSFEPPWNDSMIIKIEIRQRYHSILTAKIIQLVENAKYITLASMPQAFLCCDKKSPSRLRNVRYA